jgi:hypothetical protein
MFGSAPPPIEIDPEQESCNNLFFRKIVVDKNEIEAKTKMHEDE